MFSSISKFSRSTSLKHRFLRFYGKQSDQRTTTTINNPPAINVDVGGLSGKCVDVPAQPVGPGAAKDKEYKNPEYFCYHVDSFAEAMVELQKYRLPAPSNKKKSSH
ncbi:uncharacterized protein [Chelonus insularis]|uniref:uncharacterized protein n=1 Tax=Chelonus insularis TaxID=460826 RepID=UPI00158B443E|nr:uncharacterized protein LOC118067524 [Chelonus insularis]